MEASHSRGAAKFFWVLRMRSSIIHPKYDFEGDFRATRPRFCVLVRTETYTLKRMRPTSTVSYQEVNPGQEYSRVIYQLQPLAWQ